MFDTFNFPQASPKLDGLLFILFFLTNNFFIYFCRGGKSGQGVSIKWQQFRKVDWAELSDGPCGRKELQGKCFRLRYLHCRGHLRPPPHSEDWMLPEWKKQQTKKQSSIKRTELLHAIRTQNAVVKEIISKLLLQRFLFALFRNTVVTLSRVQLVTLSQ